MIVRRAAAGITARRGGRPAGPVYERGEGGAQRRFSPARTSHIRWRSPLWAGTLTLPGAAAELLPSSVVSRGSAVRRPRRERL